MPPKITSNDTPSQLSETSATNQLVGQELSSGELDYIEGELKLCAQGAKGQRLDKWLASQLPQYSRSRLQAWIALGAVEIDENTVSQKQKLKGTEWVLVRPQALEAQKAFVAEPVQLELVYEDDAILVVNKPAGLVVHPAPGHWQGTLMNGLLHHHAPLFELPRAGIVHRLDKDTSGLMVVAKTEEARQTLIQMIAARQVSRRYLAFVHRLCPVRFTVEAAIGRDPHQRQRMAAFSSPGGQAKAAKTDFRRLAEASAIGLGLSDSEHLRASIVECRLHSGRTHQIRVHAALKTHPLIGDTLYGGPRCVGLSGQALHAWRLSFEHPSAIKHLYAPGARSAKAAQKAHWLNFVAPLPTHLQTLAASLNVEQPALLKLRDQPYEET